MFVLLFHFLVNRRPRPKHSPVDEQRHEDERDGDAADVVLVVGDHLGGVGVVGVLGDGGRVEQDVGDVEQRGRGPGRRLSSQISAGLFSESCWSLLVCDNLLKSTCLGL